MANWRAAAVVGLVLAGAAQAQAQDWRQVERLKPGTRVEVAGPASIYGEQVRDRCRVVSVDAGSLTCAEEGWHGARLVYPVGQIESVYRVRRTVPVWAVLGLAVLGVFLGGIASSNATAVGIGLVGGIVALVVAGVSNEQRGWDAMWGRPPAPPREDDKLELVYYRGFVSGGAPGASIP